MLVADGVGGNAAGERASSLALEGVIQYLLNAMHWIFRPEDEREDTFMEDLKSALSYSQERIQHAAEATPSQHGMGTTITMAYIVWPHVYLVHAGDSRAYLFRNGKLVRLTQDQTYAQALADVGVLEPEQIETSPLNHVLSSLLGCNPGQLQPLVFKSKLELNDSLLLCTDGLTRHLSEPEIAQVVAKPKCAMEICRELIDLTNDAGGIDNTTVVIARFADNDSAMVSSAEAHASADEDVAHLLDPIPNNV